MNVILRIVASLLLVAGLAAESRGQTQPTTGPAGGLDRLRTRLFETYADGDVSALLQYLHPEVVVTWPDGEVVTGRDGVSAYVEKMTRGPDAVVERYTNKPEVQHRDLEGNLAVSHGLMHDHYLLKNGRGEFDLNSRFTVVATRSADGPPETDGWVIRAFHQSTNAFDNPVLKKAAGKSFTYGAVGGALVGAVLAALIVFTLTRRKHTVDRA